MSSPATQSFRRPPHTVSPGFEVWFPDFTTVRFLLSSTTRQRVHHQLCESEWICVVKMASSTSTCWTIVHQDDASDQASDVQSLRNALEKGNDDVKLQTMQKILIIMLNGNPLPGLLMHVIRFVRVICCSVSDVLGHAEQKQATQKASPVLLGGLSENKPGWKIKAGDDSGLVCRQHNNLNIDELAMPSGMTSSIPMSMSVA